jgi:hypothetical protein
MFLKSLTISFRFCGATCGDLFHSTNILIFWVLEELRIPGMDIFEAFPIPLPRIVEDQDWTSTQPIFMQGIKWP